LKPIFPLQLYCQFFLLDPHLYWKDYYTKDREYFILSLMFWGSLIIISLYRFWIEGVKNGIKPVFDERVESLNTYRY
jgi:hypothetical protein